MSRHEAEPSLVDPPRGSSAPSRRMICVGSILLARCYLGVGSMLPNVYSDTGPLCSMSSHSHSPLAFDTSQLRHAAPAQCPVAGGRSMDRNWGPIPVSLQVNKRRVARVSRV